MSAVLNGGAVAHADNVATGSAPRADAILQVTDLTVSFDGFRAVDGLSLSIEKNELRVIIGPNGAGKTTLLDIICGKTRPSSGKVVFNGHDLTQMSEHQIVRIGVGRKFQTPSVYEDLTVIENFEISIPGGQNVLGSLFFRRTEEVMERIHAVAEQVFMRDLLGHKAGRLSHGQKQWLLSRVSAGKSVIVIEHDMDFVKRIAHKVTVLHQGRVLSEGSVAEVQEDPRVIDVYLGH